jgi:thioredoxin-related protein
MKFRIFALEGCEKCNRMRAGFSESQISYFYVDAEKPETQALCDRYNVDEVPHCQLLSDDGKVLYEHVGFIEVADLLKAIEDRLKKKVKPDESQRTTA